MKFGEHLLSSRSAEWSASYLDYASLDQMIAELKDKHVAALHPIGKGTSLSVPRPTNAAGMPIEGEVSQERFFLFLEHEMKKIEEFTYAQVCAIREVLGEVSPSGGMSVTTRAMVDEAAERFLKLEKYVNLNFTGFHKILKKHDRHLPNPCKALYLARLHEQSWIRGDYSDILVTLSRVYSALRGDEDGPANGSDDPDSSPCTSSASHSTRSPLTGTVSKYWVRTEDVSRVKYVVLQHLPVVLQKTMAGETDSQLVNSTYVDNAAMELYHQLVHGAVGARTIRFRWYGTGAPQTMFVNGVGDEEGRGRSRIAMTEQQVVQAMRGLREHVESLESEADEGVRECPDVVAELVQVISSKQLVPTMRTQYMRTSFQSPSDASVRISLDTNLCMINERTNETLSGQRWYRDPTVKVPLHEITRFPHAVLQMKLQSELDAPPEWLVELKASGMLMEVHNFSKFVHGCAVLLPDEVRTVPYWIDDQSIKSSMPFAKQLAHLSPLPSKFQHLLPIEKLSRIPRRLVYSYNLPDSGFASEVCFGVENPCAWGSELKLEDSIRAQKQEPKSFFANERTLLMWLNTSVILASITSALLAFSKHSLGFSSIIALLLLPCALALIVYSVNTFLWRCDLLKNRTPGRWDDPLGPIIMSFLLVFSLSAYFILKKYATRIDTHENNTWER